MHPLTPDARDAADEGAEPLAVLADEVLVLAALGRVPGASVELFQRWFDAGYDVALGIVHRPDLAAATVQEAMLEVWAQFDRLPAGQGFSGVLLHAVRRAGLKRSARDRWLAGADQEPVEPDDDPSVLSEMVLRRRLVTTATQALGEREASLLDLHLRHGLAAAQIAEGLGKPVEEVSQLLFQLRSSMRDALGAAALWRDGRPTCVALSARVSGSAFDAQVVASVLEHRKDCSDCLRESSRQTSLERLMVALPMAVAPEALREQARSALVAAGMMLPVPLAPTVQAVDEPVADEPVADEPVVLEPAIAESTTAEMPVPASSGPGQAGRSTVPWRIPSLLVGAVAFGCVSVVFSLLLGSAWNGRTGAAVGPALQVPSTSPLQIPATAPATSEPYPSASLTATIDATSVAATTTSSSTAMPSAVPTTSPSGSTASSRTRKTSSTTVSISTTPTTTTAESPPVVTVGLSGPLPVAAPDCTKNQSSWTAVWTISGARSAQLVQAETRVPISPISGAQLVCLKSGGKISVIAIGPGGTTRVSAKAPGD
jgi:RNA polymerase sigma factor (sigma-70 family)